MIHRIFLAIKTEEMVLINRKDSFLPLIMILLCFMKIEVQLRDRWYESRARHL